jgi:hypothetical protein
VWIGFDDLTAEGAFTWMTSAPVLFTQWSAGEPNDNDTEDCAEMGATGQWNDNQCGVMRRALCECDPFFQPPPVPACLTSSAYNRTFHGRPYRLRAAATFATAANNCQADGATLVSIGDADENAAMENFVDEDSWIGYTDQGSEGSFRWLNGAPNGFEGWSAGQPDNFSPEENCAEILSGSGNWNDSRCGPPTSQPSICECDPSAP